MDKPNDLLHEAKKLRLLAAALELQHYTCTAANVVPIPGGDRVIVIGTAAEVVRLIEIAPAPRGIYVASRASVPARPQMWRGLRADGWPITSTWIDEAGEGETGDLGELWQRIAREIAASCGVILYAEESDFPLKGAFIECGMALGMGKPVAVVLKFPLMDRSMKPLGSWGNHPLVKLCQSLDQARRYVESVATPGAAPAHDHSEGSHHD